MNPYPPHIQEKGWASMAGPPPLAHKSPRGSLWQPRSPAATTPGKVLQADQWLNATEGSFRGLVGREESYSQIIATPAKETWPTHFRCGKNPHLRKSFKKFPKGQTPRTGLVLMTSPPFQEWTGWSPLSGHAPMTGHYIRWAAAVDTPREDCQAPCSNVPFGAEF